MFFSVAVVVPCPVNIIISFQKSSGSVAVAALGCSPTPPAVGREPEWIFKAADLHFVALARSSEN